MEREWVNVGLIILNIIFGIGLGFEELAFFRQIRHRKIAWKWIKLLLGMIGFYWAGLYIYVFLAHFKIIPLIIDPVDFGASAVRAPITFWLASCWAGARIRRIGNPL